MLEEAAKTDHAFAMFNLGIMHLYGYATAWGGERDVELAAGPLPRNAPPEWAEGTAFRLIAGRQLERSYAFFGCAV